MNKKTKTSFRVLRDPLLNKDTAFDADERAKYGLQGMLPDTIETIRDQLLRVRDEFARLDTNIGKHIFLRALQDRNEVLFYRFVIENIIETLPIIYTPVVGEACERFHHIYRQPRGIFLNYHHREHLDQILAGVAKERDIKVIVVTDGERILGLGDQGVGGLGIPIGKLSLYTALGGVHPKNTLPIILDVGTNNIERLEDIQYLGWRHKRVTGDEYMGFLDDFVSSVKKHFPNVLLQFEDFAKQHAYPLLERNRDKLCTFNDDIQGTAAVVVAAVLSAIRSAKLEVGDLKVAILGAGSAGCGICEQLISAFILEGRAKLDSRNAFYMVDKDGLLHDEMTDLLPFQKPLARKHSDIAKWSTKNKYTLLDVIEHAKPNVLIGVSGQSNQFTEEIVKTMHKYCKRPIIFPLSNPTSHAEAKPVDLLNWTNGLALVATGSPFADVNYEGHIHKISQSNNAYIFPGMGLAVLAGKITRVTDSMFLQAARALSEAGRELNTDKSLVLPELSQIRAVSEKIAVSVIHEAIESGYSKLDPTEIIQAVRDTMWYPDYDSLK